MPSPDDRPAPPADASAAPSPPIPRYRPGGLDRDGLVDALAAWLASDAMQRLATASGWPWPDGPARTVLEELAARSEDWDFRRRLAAGPNPERHTLTSIRAEIGDRPPVDEELVSTAAAQLGLAGGRAITGSFTHVVVLGGMARACLARSREAGRRVQELGIGRVAVLTAHRALGGREPDDARDAGWGDLALESEAATAAAREVFGLVASPDHESESWWPDDDPEAPPHIDAREWQRRRSWARRRWELPELSVEVFAAPSGDPSTRRTNTSDQLDLWAEQAAIGRSDDVLLVTTDHYVPAQHLDAVRILGLRRGCGVETCGVPWVSTGPYRGAAYLQEVRSALLAARRLLDDIDALQGGAASQYTRLE